MLAFNVFPCDFSVRRKKSFGDRRGSFCVRPGLERALKSRQAKSQANVASSTQAQTSPISLWKNRESEKEDRRNGSSTIASSKVGPEPRRRAQSVETAEGGQEYPTEEAPRKTAKTEPTEGQTDAAAETEAQDPTVEPPEPEGEALSLDSIDDLVLPGDVDPGEEQQSQRWRITDDGCADWAPKKDVKSMNLAQKFVELRRACPEIIKKQHSDGVKYKFAKIFDVYELLAPAMNEWGVDWDIVKEVATRHHENGDAKFYDSFIQHTRNGDRVVWVYEADITLRWINVDQGEDDPDNSDHSSDASPAGQNGRQNAPQPQGGGNGQPRQQSARNGSQSAQRKRQEKSRAQLFLPENAKIKKYEKISQKLLTKPPARCIMYVQSTSKVHTRR